MTLETIKEGDSFYILEGLFVSKVTYKFKSHENKHFLKDESGKNHFWSNYELSNHLANGYDTYEKALDACILEVKGYLSMLEGFKKG